MDFGKRRDRLVKLDWKGDPETLDELYWACQTGRHERQIERARFSWRELIVAWRQGQRIQGKFADSTKTSYRKTMDAIMEKNGPKEVRKTTRSAVRMAHAKLNRTPREADKYLQIISLLWNYASRKLDWPIGENPASSTMASNASLSLGQLGWLSSWRAHLRLYGLRQC